MKWLPLLALLSWTSPVTAKLIDRIVAVVNDEIITQSELEDTVKVPMARTAEVADPVSRNKQKSTILKRGLEDLIGKRLVLQEATKRNISVDDRDVDGHLKRVQTQQGWSDQQMQMYLTSQGLSLASFKNVVRKNLLEQRVIGAVLGSRIRIGDRDLEDYYKEKRTQENGEFEVDAAHIVLKVRTGASPDEEASIRQQAVDILTRARAGEDFSTLAKQHSQGPGATRGGSLGTLRRGSLNPKLEQAIFSIDAGKIGGPYRSPFGYHVINIAAKRRLPSRSFAEVKGQLRSELHKRKLKDEMGRWIDELRAKAFVDVRLYD